MPTRLAILVTALLACPGAGCALLGGVSDPASEPALYALTPSVGSLVPAFAPGVTEYRLEVAMTSAQLSLTPIAGADDAVITIAGAPVADEVAAELALSPGEQLVEVAVTLGDATRAYRITVVRGLLAERGAPLSASRAGDRLGQALVLAGDTIAIGAPATMTGAPVAGVPVRGAIYAAEAGAPLSAAGALGTELGEDGDGLGSAIALAGDLLIVGAPGSDAVAPTGEPVRDAGRAHVFARSDGRWHHQASLAAAAPRAGDRFGAAVAVMGSGEAAVIVVGAPAADRGEDLADAGAAHVFVVAGGAWIEDQVLAVGNPGRGDGFGTAIAARDDAIVVGAPGRASGASTAAGAVYRFARVDGAWVERRVLAPGTPVTGAAFGQALAIDDGVMVVGAPGVGEAHVYHGLEDPLPDARLALDGDPGFGASVAIDGDLVVVGAPGGTGAARGAAAVFGRRGAGWTLAHRLVPAAPRDGDRFGAAVAVSGLQIAVGAPGLAPAPGVATFAGAVHRFE